ncbi:MAG TPA: glycosyltransferase family 10 [Saprospiraceae bacterium]|nr:glycosyltransferase family 10 [Lacibacter sp.]HMO89985.1 glycosyltransferase family 10 [Lacibacter sp.]HMQ08616.1 glycosyltransferase family 10 [Saprospiraceae bacterium]
MKIKVAFSDFWKGFEPDNNWFYQFLTRHFDIELSDQPDFLIYSTYGHQYLRYNCARIFYTAENRRPDFWACDYAISFDFNTRKNHYRLPLYGIWDGLNSVELTKPKPTLDRFLSEKTKFCCMVVSNPQAHKRIDFFHKLSRYKQVDSGGKHLNNIGGAVTDKIEFIKDYKFVLAFENSSYRGYVTEKVFQPMFVNTIPVYWGSPEVHKDFNTKSFVNWHDYGDDESVIQRIIELDQNPEAMAALLSEPWFQENKLNQYIQEELIFAFFQRIFTTSVKPVAASWRRWPAILSRKWDSYNLKKSRKQ